MTVKEIEKNALYLITCRDNYFKGIRPSKKDSINEKGYQTLIAIAKAYFDGGLQDRFKTNFVEVQYLVDLWTAHLIIEYGSPSEQLKMECYEIIKRYSATPLNEAIAAEEKLWLENNKQ
jgi:hypothetical protein